MVELLIVQGFVTEAPLPERSNRTIYSKGSRLRCRDASSSLHSEVAARRDDPEKRGVASIKTVILEALAAYGFEDIIRQSDIEVQAGIFMKRQSAQMRRR